MRYEDWDILLFPKDCKIPMKEFRVACHVIEDAESLHTHTSFGLPTVCCFVPSLLAGTPFQISLHSWATPSISHFTMTRTRKCDTVKLEGRVYIDGRFVVSTELDRAGGWPHVVACSAEVSKNGDLDPLKFPPFQQELLQQSYWSPADDIGRIKVVISERFIQESRSAMIERVRNIVAFSFQHAPLEILESSSIAWPNPSMWRRLPFTTSMPAPVLVADNVDSHAHSPRHHDPSSTQIGEMARTDPEHSTALTMIPGMNSRWQLQTGHGVGASVQQDGVADPFNDAKSYFEWLGGLGLGTGKTFNPQTTGDSRTRADRKSSTDTSMPDYEPPKQNKTPPCQTSTRPAVPELFPNQQAQSCYLKVPTNTPTGMPQTSCDAEGIPFPLLPYDGSVPCDLANHLANSLLNQSIPSNLQPQSHDLNDTQAFEVKARKEKRRNSTAEPVPCAGDSRSNQAVDGKDMRRGSHQMAFPTAIYSSPQNPDDGTEWRKLPSLTGPLATNDSSAEGGLMATLACSIEKGTKRARSFDPSKPSTAEKSEGVPQGSPRARLSPCVEFPKRDGN